MAQRKVKVVVRGKVQGVWFRAWTQMAAEEIGVFGRVRNLSDGSVEAIILGDETDVGVMIEKLHEGSPQSEVTGVEVEEGPEVEVDEARFCIVR
jgi:acylphosphatase